MYMLAPVPESTSTGRVLSPVAKPAFMPTTLRCHWMEMPVPSSALSLEEHKVNRPSTYSRHRYLAHRHIAAFGHSQ